METQSHGPKALSQGSRVAEDALAILIMETISAFADIVFYILHNNITII
jgi:hypothetical protein